MHSFTKKAGGLLAALALAVLGALPAFAAQAPILRVRPQAETAYPGETVTVDVCLEGISDPVGGLQLTLEYDADRLVCEQADAGPLCSDDSYLTVLNDTRAGAVSLVFVAERGVTRDGTALTVDFRVKADAADSTQLTLTGVALADNELPSHALEVEVQNASVQLLAATPKPTASTKPTPTASTKPTPTASAKPGGDEDDEDSEQDEETPTPIPTALPAAPVVPAPTPRRTVAPTMTTAPAATPAPTATAKPTATPTPKPTATPTATPTPTVAPTQSPTQSPAPKGDGQDMGGFPWWLLGLALGVLAVLLLAVRQYRRSLWKKENDSRYRWYYR